MAKPLKSLVEFNSRVCMSVCVTLFVCVFLCERCVCVCVCVCEWRGEFNRVVLVVQLGLIFHFIFNPEQHRLFQLVIYSVRISPYLKENTTLHRYRNQLVNAV
jgi:hypothetical protein